MRKTAILAAVGACTAQANVTLVTFDGAKGTTFEFKELNDPVMGGLSTGTWTVNTAGKFGVFDGQVVNVPSLKAPGFISVASHGSFADASGAIDGGLIVKVRSSTANYTGFRVSLISGTWIPTYACAGGGSLPLSGGCYKAKFQVPPGDDFSEVTVPFSSFTDHWSPYTGEPTKTCSQDKSVCIGKTQLKGIKGIELMAEGIAGKIHLEVESIFTTATGLSAAPPKQYNKCKGSVQKNLRFNMSARTTPDIPVAVDPTESLAEAVCCDSRTKVYAEPQFLYQAPDINLFGLLDDKSVTTFYDSVCGVPLFRAPVNRTFAEFKADTDEHGWPSFRDEEVIKEHVTYDKDGFTYSSCGTHLGSYLPDAKGPRYCMDLSCISGNKAITTEVIV